MKKHITLILVCICILVATLSGCGKTSADKPSAEKAAVCFVIGGHANSQGLNMNSPLVQDTVYTTVRNYGFVGIVSVDGKPEVLHAASYDIDAKYKNASTDKLDMDARAKSTGLIAGMQSIAANDPEVDYLEALRLAVRVLSPLEGYDSKRIICLGTGLNTTGIMDFSKNIISADPDVVVSLMEEKSEIPDFAGISVYWQQLGDVAAPQQAMSPAQRANLQQIYGRIVEAGNGSFFYNDIIANPVDTTLDLPAVSPVELPEETPIIFEPACLDEAGDNAFEEPIILTGDQVAFISDKAEYLQPDLALQTLQPIADYLTQRPNVHILLVGTTAGDQDSEGALTLSQSRAEAVRRTLVELGVEADRITAVGLGSERDPWHIWGAGYDGAAAASNRKVVVMDAASDMAASILADQTP